MTRIRIDDLPIAEELTPEQEALILGAGLKSFRPSLEALEAREVPALLNPSAPNIDFDKGTLKIDANRGASAQSNRAVVSYVPGSNGSQLKIEYNFTSATVAADRVSRIVFVGNNAAQDSFTNNTIKPSQFTTMETRDTYVHYESSFKMTGPSYRFYNDSVSGRRMVAPRDGVDPVRVGDNTPPPLSWSGLPANTASLTLDMTDPDATDDNGNPSPFNHMRISGIPSWVRNLDDAMRYGRMEANGEGQNRYLGPNPPGTETHRYVFTLTALAADGRTVLGQTTYQMTFGYGSATQAETPDAQIPTSAQRPTN